MKTYKPLYSPEKYLEVMNKTDCEIKANCIQEMNPIDRFTFFSEASQSVRGGSIEECLDKAINSSPKKHYQRNMELILNNKEAQ